MMGNNFELLDHIRISRVTAGGMFRIFITFYCLFGKTTVGVMALLLKMREKNPTVMKNESESAEVLWVHVAGSKTTEGSEL